MNKRNWLPMLLHLASPAALTLLGVVLLFSPDAGAAMLTRLLGWLILLAGISAGAWALFSRDNVFGKLLGAAVSVGIGNWLLRHPLALASWIGRVLGLLLLLRGLRDLGQSRRRGHGRLLAWATTGMGIFLILVPLATSRLLFSLCGLVILVIGVVMFLDRLKDRDLLEAGDKPDIIDAL